MLESLGVDFGVEVGSYLGFSDGYVERNVGVYSVEFYQGVVELPLLGAKIVAVSAVVARTSSVRS